eukprot:TRINITY_DN5687_c0_g1_i3.p1 TRINITY_DN5687_c0_g1~~TRINITY_DN5687_c0_g1_i3.p1  ORF type:complete len:126 (+),score=21.31 TRINITY_DN5687_c0_g1_i3:89-466(+)
MWCTKPSHRVIKLVNFRKPYVGTPSPLHAKILMDRSVSCEKTRERLDSECLHASYNQIMNSRNQHQPPVGRSSTLSDWNAGKYTATDTMTLRKPYVGKPSPEHERILIDKRYPLLLQTAFSVAAN